MEDLFALTRKLVEIESTTGNEKRAGEFLVGEMVRRGYHVERIQVTADRFNVFARPNSRTVPRLVFSTHMDTVPPYIPLSEDDDCIYGRGACDAKGIIASQITAADALRSIGIETGLLFVVGEERDSIGARTANRCAPGSKFLINGEPTDNRLAAASKGSLRVKLVASGKMAHSGYPHLGDSATHKLVHVISRLLDTEWPTDPEVGTTTLNVGTVQGGRAPNVVADAAWAEIVIRLVGDSHPIRTTVLQSLEPGVEAEFLPEVPFTRLSTIPQMPTMIAAYTTDIPHLSNWGAALMLGPGSITTAHTTHEFVLKSALIEAIGKYVAIARYLTSSGDVTTHS